jgi:hypothetical protein
MPYRLSEQDIDQLIDQYHTHGEIDHHNTAPNITVAGQPRVVYTDVFIAGSGPIG